MNEENTVQVMEFARFLRQEDRSEGTVEKYVRDVRAFLRWLDDKELTREATGQWKNHLQQTGYAPVTINGMLVSLNRFLQFTGQDVCRVRLLKIQRQIFRSESRELSRAEYERLLHTAKNMGRYRLALLLETICATGIRVSELRHITVSAAQAGRATISLKGKIRTILLPGKLCRKLLNYAKKQKIVSGEIFLTRNGTPISRKQIWAEMKALCKAAGVEASKVFPHNLRHLFARVYYTACKDVAKLADILGHSSLETTRIYLISTGSEHQMQLERLGLVS